MTRTRTHMIVIYANAYEGLEDQLRYPPAQTLRKGSDVVLCYDMTRDRKLRWSHEGPYDGCYWSNWQHPIADDIRFTGAIIDDQLDPYTGEDYDWTESENVAVIVLENGREVEKQGSDALASRFAHLYSGLTGAFKESASRWIPAGTNVFIGCMDMREKDLKALERDFPVAEVRQSKGFTLVRIVSADHGIVYEDKYSEHLMLDWPELNARIADVGYATEDRQGFDEAHADPNESPFAWCAASADGYAQIGNWDHPIWDHFGMQVERSFSVTFQ